MKVSVQFPLKTDSENKIRSLPFAVANAPRGKQMGIAHAIAGAAKKQRKTVRMMLDSQLPRLRSRVPSSLLHPYADAKENTYRVTMIRISAGTLDDDGLAGALKHVQDEIAAWLGVDDGPLGPVRWQRAQQRGPRGVYAVRIEIADDDPDPREAHRIVGGPIAKLGPMVGLLEDGAAIAGNVLLGAARDVRGSPDRLQTKLAQHRSVQRQEQAPLVFRRAFYALPGEQRGDEATLRELTRPPFVDGAIEPPRALRLKHCGERLTLERRLCNDFPDLGEIWLYEAPASPRSSVTRHHEQREASRT